MTTWIETGENGTGVVVKDEPGAVVGRIWARTEPAGDGSDLIKVGGVTSVAHDPATRENVEAVAVVVTLDNTVPEGWTSAVETMTFEELESSYRRLDSSEVAVLRMEAELAAKERADAPPLNTDSPWRR